MGGQVEEDRIKKKKKDVIEKIFTGKPSLDRVMGGLLRH